MKRTVILLISLFIALSGYGSRTPGRIAGNISASDSVSVLSTPDLYGLTLRWVSEYTRSFPSAKINVISVSDTKVADLFMEKGTIGFVSNDYYSGFGNESVWKIVVGRDIIVPVINSKNPLIDEIYEKGVSPENLALFFSNKDSGNWKTLLNGSDNSPANYYSVNDPSISKSVNEYLKSDISGGIRYETADEMLMAIKRDKYSIGFCKLINLLDPKSQAIDESIKLMPIDRNGNGIIDSNEKIFEDLNVFSRGIWIGKYPKVLVSNIYSVSSKQPMNDSEVAFLKWVLSDGQQYLYSGGYSDLLVSERETSTDKLYEAQMNSTIISGNNSLFRTILIFAGLIILAGLAVDFVSRYMKRKKSADNISDSKPQGFLDEKSMVLPGGLYFDKTHTWAFMEQNGFVKVGIDDFLQHVTGNISRIKMKKGGDKVRKGEQILSVIQNGKQLNIYSPVSGVIKEINSALEKDASLVNSSPYNQGWIYKLEPTNWIRENQLLFMAAKHKEFLKSEFSRLKDFFAAALKEDDEKYALIILQDGGELADNTLSNLGPEVWEDFQSKFIDPSRQVWFHELF